MPAAHVTHIGEPFAPIAVILDAHLPAPHEWHVTWAGEHAHVVTDGGAFTIESGRTWGPAAPTGRPLAPYVGEAFRAVGNALTDRLIRKMCGVGQ